MAHPKSKRTALRSAYCFKALALEQAAELVGVSVATARRWRTEALAAEEDDWEKVRAASSLAGEGMEGVARQMLCDYVMQHKTLMEQVSGSDLPPELKVDALSKLADSFAKVVASSRRILPETDQLATALEVIRKLADFTRAHFPRHAPALLEILEPFGAQIAKELG